MSKKRFTEREIKILSDNPHVKSVSSKGITYTEDFKCVFIAENENGKSPRQIFEENGFEIEVIGMERVKSSGKRWRAAYKRRNKGARQIKMTLEGEFNINYNLKRIRRIMKKYDIVCPIRRANPYKKMIKATQEHRVLPNLLNREFKQGIPGRVLLTDITYLYYGNGQKAYLSTIKDGYRLMRFWPTMCC